MESRRLRIGIRVVGIIIVSPGDINNKIIIGSPGS